MSMTPRRLLLVDDCPAELRLMMEAWRAVRPDVNIQTAESADAVLCQLTHQLAADGPLPQLTLLDVHLPDRSGLEVLEHMKSHPQLQTIPVVMISTLQAPDLVRRAYRLHANGYVPKPDSWERYLQMVTCMDRFWFHTARLPDD